MRFRGRRLVVIVLGVIGVGALLFIAVPTIINRFAFFRIASVEFEGVQYLAPQDLLDRLAIPPSSHILVDLEPIEARARDIPGIREARITRRWPGTLVVRVREAVPVALVSVEGQLMVMDVTGEVLPWSPSRIEHPLPIAPQDSTVASLLGRLRLADPQGYGLLDRVRRQGGDLWLDAGRHTVRLRLDAGSGVLRHVGLVREWLADSAVSWRQLDARVPTRFFVLKGGEQ
ncbi:MAG TPA: FtsQ-type POTRA domain-containing protein [Gemmatimonadales bacterium]|nr:FtsQ-type POTRA domain-containing protein [Gemmatimonadales bacterium]